MTKAIESADEIPYDGTFEDPRGEMREHPYLGEVQLFSAEQIERAHNLNKGHGKVPSFLEYHVPLNMRGQYKLETFPGKWGEKKGPANYAMCTAVKALVNNRNEKIKDGGNPCRGKAINYSGRCSRHGGALHLLDRKRINWDAAPRHIRFKYGKLSVEELDDEELAKGQIRKPDGKFTDNNFVSAEIHQQIVSQLYMRADQKLQENLLATVDSITEIAQGTAYEPADRLKAATWVYERLRGKTPTEIKLTADKPFEKIIDVMFSGGSRADSRARRGVEEDAEDILDAEVVDLDHDAKFIEEELAAAQELTAEEIDEEPSYDDPEDKPLRHAELQPAPPVHYGPASKAYHHRPPDDEGSINHDRQIAANDKAAQAREAALLRKAQKEKMRKALATRKYFQNEGHSTLPVALPMSVEQDGDEATFTFEHP